jgi:type I restriction enzyme S subunit
MIKELVKIGHVTLNVRKCDPKQEWPNQEVSYIDIASIDRERKCIDNVSIIPSALAPSRARQIIAVDDILVSTVRPNLNAVALVPQKFDGAVASTGFTVLRPDGHKVHGPYLFHWVKSNSFVSEMIRKSTGASYPAVSDGIVKSSYIPLPPLAEQKRIAAILDKANELKHKRKQAIEKLDELVQAVFIDMFGDIWSNSLGWDIKPLGKLVTIDAPMVDPRKPEYQDLLHIGPDRIEKLTGKFLPALTAKEDGLISGKFLFDTKYVLYSKIRPYLRKVALPDFKGLCSADMYPICPLPNALTREYLWTVLVSAEFVKYTESLASRASIPKINRKELLAYPMMVPPFDKQKEFSKKFSKIFDRKMSFERFDGKIVHLINSLNANLLG